MSQTDQTRPETEGRFHHYTGNKLPWYIHLIWVLFWIFVVIYGLMYLLPALRTEIVNPP